MKVILIKIFKKFGSLSYFLYRKYIKKHIKLSSDPFITGDTIRLYSNHVLDEASKINFAKIKAGDIVFVKTDYLGKFSKLNINELPNNTVLVTHNSDINIRENPFGDKLGEKSIHWFAQNLELDSTNNRFIHPLPIGFENRNWLKNGKLSVLRNTKNKEDKKDKILCAFNTSTNKERIKILYHLDSNDNVEYLRRTNHKKYMNTLSEYKISICPPGNGLDTHRIWESLLVKTLPLVKKTAFSNNLFLLGVPLLLIDSWDELEEINKNYIKDAYSTYQEKLKEQKFTNVNFWIEKMKEVH
jgi:hypothetical protein